MCMNFYILKYDQKQMPILLNVSLSVFMKIMKANARILAVSLIFNEAGLLLSPCAAGNLILGASE